MPKPLRSLCPSWFSTFGPPCSTLPQIRLSIRFKPHNRPSRSDRPFCVLVFRRGVEFASSPRSWC